MIDVRCHVCDALCHECGILCREYDTIYIVGPYVMFSLGHLLPSAWFAVLSYMCVAFSTLSVMFSVICV